MTWPVDESEHSNASCCLERSCDSCYVTYYTKCNWRFSSVVDFGGRSGTHVIAKAVAHKSRYKLGAKVIPVSFDLVTCNAPTQTTVCEKIILLFFIRIAFYLALISIVSFLNDAPLTYTNVEHYDKLAKKNNTAMKRQIYIIPKRDIAHI